MEDGARGLLEFPGVEEQRGLLWSLVDTSASSNQYSPKFAPQTLSLRRYTAPGNAGSLGMVLSCGIIHKSRTAVLVHARVAAVESVESANFGHDVCERVKPYE